jgi:hypothetical protein
VLRAALAKASAQGAAKRSDAMTAYVRPEGACRQWEGGSTRTIVDEPGGWRAVRPGDRAHSHRVALLGDSTAGVEPSRDGDVASFHQHSIDRRPESTQSRLQSWSNEQAGMLQIADEGGTRGRTRCGGSLRRGKPDSTIFYPIVSGSAWRRLVARGIDERV